MTEHNDPQQADELGAPLGPQGAAQAALEPEIDGHEGASSEQAPPVDDSQEWREILKTAFMGLFAIASTRWPKMAASAEECDQLAQVWTPVAQKHAGASIPIEAVAVVATVAIVAPKALAAKREHDEERARAQAAQVHRDPGTAHI